MDENDNIEQPATGNVLRLASSTRTPRLALSTLKQCRTELASLYRHAKAGLIQPADASRLAFILTQTAKLIELADAKASAATTPPTDQLETRRDALDLSDLSDLSDDELEALATIVGKLEGRAQSA